MTQLKSLAHPEWPYTGTPHEWRGFVKRDRRGPIYIGHDKDYYGLDAVRMFLREYDYSTYQKLNFGRDLP